MKLDFISSSGLRHFSAPARRPTAYCGAAAPGLGAAASSMRPQREAFRQRLAGPSRSAAYAAFGAVVLACVLAAAMLVSVDMPLMLGGL